MKLVSYPTSPFARKVRIAAIEVGVDDRLEIVEANPLADDGVVAMHNPLGKVPALVLDDRTLVDSPLICAYLDTLHAGPKLHPDGDWCALQLQALGDGMLDATVLRRLELMRPESLRSLHWIARYEAAVQRTLVELARLVSALPDAVTIGTITVGCALEYLERRYPELNWRGREPGLAAWFEIWNARPAAVLTAPPPGHLSASEALGSGGGTRH
ncbi:MAG TPA: glutathione S-transferase N-terminal domain-containing protein [Polyangiaceae bacterium]|jgi:glutathione S-transferase|nr:glutathione S-transferase N-terminal domain-containing protein [Polyangiaceae bacterium]